MKRKKIICLIGILLLISFAGCQRKKEPSVKGPYLFYQNIEGTGLTMVDYRIQKKDPESAIQSMLRQLAKSPDSVEMKAAIPKGVAVDRFELSDGILHLFMNDGYAELDEVQEVLVRASLVQSLIQIPDVKAVDIFIGNKPLTDKNGKLIGCMNSNSFVKNTGTTFKSFQKTTLTLFFPNKEGDKLVQAKEDVHHFGNVSMEKLVMEQIVKGPKINGVKEFLPKDLKILSTSVKGGICYINLGKEFLTATYENGPELVVYGIVNSVVSNCNVSRVQLAVEGDSTVKFMGKISFEEPFERNIELVE